MTLTSLLVHDVQLVHAGTITDRYGNVTKDWATATSVTVRGWITQPSGTEDQTNREADVGQWVLFLSADTMITGLDRVLWGDITFDVVGPPRRAWTPRGEHHVEVALRVVDG